MGNDQAPTIESVRDRLSRYPSPVSEEFEKALRVMPSALSEAQVRTWAREGISIADQAVRAWEAAAQYYKASPAVLGHISFGYFVKWAQYGASLCEDSPTLSHAYFEASPAALSRLRPRNIEAWSNLGRGLYNGTWKSGTLACKFFEASPMLLEALTFLELGRLVAFLSALSHRSYDLSTECLDLAQGLFPLLGEDRGALISVASALLETGWREVKGFFEAASRALPKVEAGQRLRFLRIAERLTKTEGVNASAVVNEFAHSFEELDPDDHAVVLALAESLMDISPAAVPEFIKGSSSVLERIPRSQLQRWYDVGVSVLGKNVDGGLAYFRIESSQSEQVLEVLSSAVEFARVKDVMEMYCRALAGEEVNLAATEDLVEKNIGWVSSESPSTEGSTVFVPVLVDRYGAKEDNFGWYKVVSTHQIAHLEFGSFLFEFETPSMLFRDLRGELEQRRNGRLPDSVDEPPDVDFSSLEQGYVTDMQRYFNLFDDRKLALDVFTVVEDGRLDARVRAEYPGLRHSYSRVQRDSLDERPDARSMPARQAMLELVVRLSLLQTDGLPVPRKYADESRKVATIAQRVFVPEASVQDVAEASLRIYAIVSRIPNEQVTAEDWQNVDGEDCQEYADPDEMDILLQQIAQGMDQSQPAEGENEYEATKGVEYRGDFKPELVQLLTLLRAQQQDQKADAEAEPLTREQLEELLENSAELDLQPTNGNAGNPTSLFASNLMKEAGLSLPESPGSGQGPPAHTEEQGGPLEKLGPQDFIYDEWDFRAEDYKPRWCVVRQKTMAEGDPDFFSTTLHSYGSVLARVRRQFELMVPEMLRKVRRLEDGEDIDIDDVIEAIVDIRTGATPSDKYFWRRNKVQRDVAVAFLLDTSASTAEAIDDSKKSAIHSGAPDDPAEYMVWLRARRGETMNRSYKRIIDIEKEAVVLLVNALEAIGDVYGIYGFSGYGRENVEFFTIKDMEETFSERIKRRIDRIAPLHATRMGPAIRHTTKKLDEQDARTKLLFLISDGRPQDRGYSREGVEKEYAVHDTKMALDEAKRKDINAFCLTVDRNGHDYLKTMCQDIGYEVLDDILVLPERLLLLYKRLTM